MYCMYTFFVRYKFKQMTENEMNVPLKPVKICTHQLMRPCGHMMHCTHTSHVIKPTKSFALFWPKMKTLGEIQGSWSQAKLGQTMIHCLKITPLFLKKGIIHVQCRSEKVTRFLKTLYRKDTSIRQAPVFRHLRALRKSPWKFIIWMNELHT